MKGPQKGAITGAGSTSDLRGPGGTGRSHADAVTAALLEQERCTPEVVDSAVSADCRGRIMEIEVTGQPPRRTTPSRSGKQRSDPRSTRPGAGPRTVQATTIWVSLLSPDLRTTRVASDSSLLAVEGSLLWSSVSADRPAGTPSTQLGPGQVHGRESAVTTGHRDASPPTSGYPPRSLLTSASRLGLLPVAPHHTSPTLGWVWLRCGRARWGNFRAKLPLVAPFVRCHVPSWRSLSVLDCTRRRDGLRRGCDLCVRPGIASRAEATGRHRSLR